MHSGSEAIHEAGVQMSRSEWLLRAADLLDGHVRFQEDGRLPAQEVQWGYRGDHESGRDRFRCG